MFDPKKIGNPKVFHSPCQRVVPSLLSSLVMKPAIIIDGISVNGDSWTPNRSTSLIAAPFAISDRCTTYYVNERRRYVSTSSNWPLIHSIPISFSSLSLLCRYNCTALIRHFSLFLKQNLDFSSSISLDRQNLNLESFFSIPSVFLAP